MADARPCVHWQCPECFCTSQSFSLDVVEFCECDKHTLSIPMDIIDVHEEDLNV